MRLLSEQGETSLLDPRGPSALVYLLGREDGASCAKWGKLKRKGEDKLMVHTKRRSILTAVISISLSDLGDMYCRHEPGSIKSSKYVVIINDLPYQE